MANLLTKEQIRQFYESGYIVLKKIYEPHEIEPIQFGIWQILQILFSKYEIQVQKKPFHPDSFDFGYQELIAKNRKYGGEVYNAVKQIPAFSRLVSLQKNEKIFREVRNVTSPAIANRGSGIRIDNPNEEKYRSLWHYEYRDQLRSLDGIVFWSPLVKITPELGPVQICPKSHLDGLRRSYLSDPENPDKEGAYAMRIEDEELLIHSYGKVAPLTEPGDLVLMDFLTLHSSGVNISERSRWSMQFRYFSFEHPSGISIAWGGPADGISLEEIHPELIISR